MKISFFVEGLARGGGSKRAFTRYKGGQIVGVGVEDASGKAGKTWRQDIQAVARLQQPETLLEGPLKVRFWFYRERPKSHYRSGSNAHLLKAEAPKAPTTKPDVLKLARAAEDALTGIIWKDDALIVDEHLYKRYCDDTHPFPGVWIVIEGWEEREAS